MPIPKGWDPWDPPTTMPSSVDEARERLRAARGKPQPEEGEEPKVNSFGEFLDLDDDGE